MSWFGSFAIGVLCAMIGCVISGLVGAACVEWYHIPSREGGSGYFVIMFMLLGIVLGFVAGFAVSRWVTASANPSAWRAIGISIGILVAIGSIAGGSARLAADVPPTVGGQELMLLVEIRWPASQVDSPVGDTTMRRLRLGSLAGTTMRKSEIGPVWLDKLRKEDGRWIAPAAVEIFTNRGKRLISMGSAEAKAHGLMLPMNGTPSTKDFQWSEWMPRARDESKPLPDNFTYRFKVIKRDQPARIDTIGPFEVGTVVSHFYETQGLLTPGDMSAYATFAVSYRGQPLPLKLLDAASASGTSTASASDEPIGIRAVATMGGEPAALLVLVDGPNSQHEAQIFADNEGKLTTTFVSNMGTTLRAPPITNDSKSRLAIKELIVADGQIDRASFMQPHVFQFSEALLDARTRTVRTFKGTEIPALNVSVPPFGVSPDGRSFVQLGFNESESWSPALVVIDADAKQTYHVNIDVAATRYGLYEALSPEWLAHYYTWEPGTNGHDKLIARTNVKPLPYKGLLHVEHDGTVNYQMAPAGQELADAMTAFLKSEFNGTVVPRTYEEGSDHVKIDSTDVTVFNNKSDTEVVVMIERDGDRTLIPKIAEHFDALLATGKYDAMFAPKKKSE